MTAVHRAVFAAVAIACGGCMQREDAAQSVDALAAAATSNVPTGTVIMWWGANGAWPTNYALCDGTKVNVGTNIFVTPDLQGKFLRGAANTNSGPADFTSGGSESYLLDVSHDHVFTNPAHSHDAGSLAAAIIYRGDNKEKFYVERANRSDLFTSTETWHFGSCCDDGLNIAPNEHVKQNDGVAVRGTTADHEDVTITTALKELKQSVPTLPPYQDLFFLIRVR